jgi:hypothetical protein
MLRTRLIKDLDEMRGFIFPPPYTLLETLETTEGRGEVWWVLAAYEQYGTQARWVAVFPEVGEARFYTDGDELRGRWDPDHEIFIPDDGSALDLRGNPVSLVAIEEEEEEEDAEAEERRR